MGMGVAHSKVYAQILLPKSLRAIGSVGSKETARGQEIGVTPRDVKKNHRNPELGYWPLVS